MSPTFTTNFMDELRSWEFQGDSECSIIFQNPSHEASIIELPPEEFIINFCAVCTSPSGIRIFMQIF